MSIMWGVARGCASECVLYSPVELACPFFGSLWKIFWWLAWSGRGDLLGACVLFWPGHWVEEEEEWIIAFLDCHQGVFSFLLASGLSFGFFLKEIGFCELHDVGVPQGGLVRQLW